MPPALIPVVTLLLALATLGLTASPAGAADPRGKAAKVEAPPKAEECLACHADKDLKRGKTGPGRGASVHVDEAALGVSSHARLECVSCHKAATAPHDERLPAVRCADCHARAASSLATGGGVHGAKGGPACSDCHGTHDVKPARTLTIQACAGCHGQEVEAYRTSIHGQSRQRGDLEAATCQSCHGAAHLVLPKTSRQSPTYHLNLPRTCAQCHADPELARRHNISVGNAYQLYMDSIHGRAVSRSGLLVSANCSDCHGSHDIRPRTDPASRVSHANIPRTCGGCHAGIEQAYVQSVHGRAVARGSKNAPICTDCHGAHQIRRVEGAPWQLDVIAECGTCHAESLRTYRDTFHGKATALGFARVAKCADCHGSHEIQPTEDPRSKVSAANIVTTCRQCHPGANWRFAQFQPHADHHDKERYPLLYYSYLFMTSLLVGTFAFFGLHTALWLPRSFAERRRHRRERQAGGEDR